MQHKSQARELARISGLGDEPDVRRLLDNKVKTLDDLWGNSGKLTDRLPQMAEATKVRSELLYALLVGDALSVLRPNKPAKRFFAAARRRKSELVLGALLVLAVLLLAYRGLTAGESIAPQVKVKAGSKLTAFRAIEPANLTLGTGGRAQGTFSSVEEVVGRYPSETVAGGTPVTEKRLLPKELSGVLGSRHLLTLAVKHGTVGQSIKMPANVWLLFPPPDEKIPKALLVKDVLLLTVRQDGEHVTATVALTESGLAEMRDYAGRTEILVIQPAAQPAAESAYPPQPTSTGS